MEQTVEELIENFEPFKDSETSGAFKMARELMEKIIQYEYLVFNHYFDNEKAKKQETKILGYLDNFINCNNISQENKVKILDKVEEIIDEQNRIQKNIFDSKSRTIVSSSFKDACRFIEKSKNKLKQNISAQIIVSVQ